MLWKATKTLNLPEESPLLIPTTFDIEAGDDELWPCLSFSSCSSLVDGVGSRMMGTGLLMISFLSSLAFSASSFSRCSFSSRSFSSCSRSLCSCLSFLLAAMPPDRSAKGVCSEFKCMENKCNCEHSMMWPCLAQMKNICCPNMQPSLHMTEIVAVFFFQKERFGENTINLSALSINSTSHSSFQNSSANYKNLSYSTKA